MSDDLFRGDDLEFTFAARVSVPYLLSLHGSLLMPDRTGAKESISDHLSLTRRSLRRYRHTLDHVYPRPSALVMK